MSANSINPEQTVAEIVSENYRNARIFREKDIDFCCGGSKTLKDVCIEKDLDINDLLEEFRKVSETKDQTKQFSNWSCETLIDYIIENHHAYAKNQIVTINKYADKVAKVHGERHPETIKIADAFEKMSRDMIIHMQKEELMLFPYIRKVCNHANKGEKLNKPVFGSLQEMIESMENDHDETGAYLHLIETESGKFTPPEDACQTYRILYSELGEFVEKTIEHVHLENNILFPQAIEIEENMK